MGQVLGLPWGDREAFAYLDELRDLGLRAFDLAASYQMGGTERLFGRWCRRGGRREDLFLISKGGHPVPVVGPHRLGEAALTKDLHGSLRRLGTDRLDLFLLHRDDQVTPLEEIARTLQGFVTSGKIRSWGLSNWHHERIARLREVAASVGLGPPAVSSPHLSLFSWQKTPWTGCVSIAHDDAAHNYYRGSGLAVLAWSPLGGGYASDPERNAAVYGTTPNAERRRRALAVAERLGQPLESVLLAYLYHKPFPVRPVVASRVPGRLAAYLRARDVSLSDEDVRFLDAPQLNGSSR